MATSPPSRRNRKPAVDPRAAPGGMVKFDNSRKSQKQKQAWDEWQETGDWQTLVDAGAVAPDRK